MGETTRSAAVPEVACACGAAHYNAVYGGVYTRRGRPYRFELFRCWDCGLVRSFPVPTVELYTSGYGDSTGAGEYVERDKPWCRTLAAELANRYAEPAGDGAVAA